MKKFTLCSLLGGMLMTSSLYAQISGYQTEGFENTIFPPPGWQQINVAGSNQWSRSTAEAQSGVASAFISYQSTAAEDWLITPQYTVTATTDSLIFWMKLDYQGYTPDSLSIKVSSTDALTSSFTNTLLLLEEGVNYPPDDDNWYRYALYIGDYNGQNIYIAFKHVNNDGDGLYIDDIALGTKPAAEVGPTVIGIDAAGVTGATLPVSVTVSNNGSVTQTFNVTTMITPGGYTSTQTVTALAPGANTSVSFAPFTPVAPGTYTITAFTDLSGDADLTNDTLTQVFNVYDMFENTGWETNILSTPSWATAPVFVKRCVSGLDTGYVYMISGADAAFANTNANLRYNMITGIWETKAPIPAARMQITPLYSNNKIYVIGGYSSSFSPVNTTSIYDIATDTWSTGAPMPAAVGDYACAVYNDSLIYIIGGYNGSVDVNTVQIYNTLADTWTTGTDKTGAAVAGGRAGITGNTIVHAGGYSQSMASSLSDAVTGTIDPADPTIITWNSIGAYPAGTLGRHAAGTLADNDGKVYFAGGDPNGEGTLVMNSVYAYNVTTSVWEAGPQMPTGVSNISALAGVIRNDSLFLVTAGGYDGAGIVTSFDWLAIGARTLSSADAIICSGSSTTLEAYNGYAYAWSPAATLDDTTSATPVASPTFATDYVVTITQKYGCPVNDTVTVTVSSMALTAVNDTVTSCVGTLTVNVSGGVMPHTYQWNDPATQTTATATGLCPGTYTVLVTDAIGCVDSISVTVVSSVGLAENGWETSVEMYPNPAGSQLTINASLDKTALTGITLINALGKQVMAIELQPVTGNYRKTVDLSGIASGVYYVRFSSAQTTITRKLVKQ